MKFQGKKLGPRFRGDTYTVTLPDGTKVCCLQVHEDYSTGKCIRYVGCSVCHAAGRKGRLAEFAVPETSIKACNLHRHFKLASHRKSLQRLYGQDVADASDAPTEAQFLQVWQSRRCGKAFRKESGIGCSKKIIAMTWCLAEGKRRLFREFLRKAASASLVQDGRQQNLLLRLKAATPTLDIKHGNICFLRGAVWCVC